MLILLMRTLAKWPFITGEAYMDNTPVALLIYGCKEVVNVYTFNVALAFTPI